MDDRIQTIANRARQYLMESAQRSGTMHTSFLEQRQQGLESIAALLERQIEAAGEQAEVLPQTDSPIQVTFPQAAILPPPALFERQQMEEFALRSMAKCFGPEFSVFEGRRHPRIPNRDLMLMSRATEINGQRHKFNKPSSIVVEYDVPADAWFYRDNASPFIPYSVWMEIALQPCGFLSAYLGTSLMFPDVDYFFRNLDGSSTLFSTIDLRGKTITTRATLLSTIANDTTIIQKFEFALSCGNERLFEGTSIFGFFPPETMANQAGLDAGKRISPQLEQLSEVALPGKWLDLAMLTAGQPTQPQARLSSGHLSFLDAIYFAPKSASRPRDYLYAIKQNDPSAWFYACHFHQDPVMPGSLGVEAIMQTIQAYALETGLNRRFRSPRFDQPAGSTMLWKYRGQILPSHPKMKLEVLIKEVKEAAGETIIVANASLWADTMRIYEIKNAVMRLSES